MTQRGGIGIVQSQFEVRQRSPIELDGRLRPEPWPKPQMLGERRPGKHGERSWYANADERIQQAQRVSGRSRADLLTIYHRRLYSLPTQVVRSRPSNDPAPHDCNVDGITQDCPRPRPTVV